MEASDGKREKGGDERQECGRQQAALRQTCRADYDSSSPEAKQNKAGVEDADNQIKGHRG